MRAVAFIAVGWLGWSLLAQASYVESCAIQATVLEDTATRRLYVTDVGGEYERYQLSARVRVDSAQADGRADSACRQFQSGETTLAFANPPYLALKQGQTIHVHYFKKTGAGMAGSESFTLVLP